jgi:hypothetical protein
MITCYLQGGLGNQLFQIFTTIAYAIKYKTKCVFSNTHELNKGATPRHTYWTTFLSNLKPFLIHMNEEIIGKCKFIREHRFSYTELPEFYSDEPIKMLVGYFQSPKYFDQYKDTIFKMIKLDTHKKNVYDKYPMDYDNTISLHFRLGDYKKLQDFHPIMTLDYYKSAIEYLLQNYQPNKVLYFCEDEDNEEVEKKIEVLKQEFPLEFVRGGSGLEDWEQMLQMSLCKHNIIANSTFSWWAAYFNTNKNQKVVYPDVWFGPRSNHHDTKDLFPVCWVSA